MIQGVCVHVCARMRRIFHTGEMATNTHGLQHLYFHESTFGIQLYKARI